MNIRINIKQCQCEPTVITKKEISEVQFKKKSMLYAPPTKDSKKTTSNINKKTQQKQQQSSSVTTKQQYQQRQSPYMVNQQDERKFLKQMNEISKNQLQSDMTQQTQTILQKQNQILQENQKTIYHMLSNQPNQNNTSAQQQQIKNQQLKRTFQQAADKIARQVKDIKKMRDQILQFGQSFKRTVQQGKGQQFNRNPQQIGQMNSNLRNLVEISKNHIQGLQNLQGIKNLQNFNIQAYTQAINTLKKQIVQYQKQSQTIQRQLKLRSAKLQKLQVSPNFDQQLLQPYQQYLKKKAQNIDLHTLKQKVYQKLGVFDYGKFETDICTLSNQIKSEMNDFYITCKQYRIQIPDIKIDKKQIKQLDLKLPSVLDEFKEKKGMSFMQRTTDQQKQDAGKKPSRTMMRQTQSKSFKNTSKNQKQLQTGTQNVFKRTSPQRMFQKGQIYTKPVDYSKSTKLTRVQDQQPKTVLQTNLQQQRRQVFKNIKKPPQQQRSQDDDFQKYLQNRAKQELAAIYEQKKKKLQQMEKQLYDKCQQQSPKYQLTMNVKNKVSPKKVIVKEQRSKRLSQRQNNNEQEQQYEQQFQEQFEQEVKREKRNLKKQSPVNKQKQQIKNIGTEVLRQKLKNLFSKNPTLNEHVHQNRLINQNQPQQMQMNQMSQMTSIAEGFVNMINNTLTQVNTQLSQSIQKKMENRSYSMEKRPQFQRKSPHQITVPKLEQFRAPPVFNMQMVYEPVQRQQEKRVEKKIVPKDYNYLRISQENNQLQISSISDDF